MKIGSDRPLARSEGLVVEEVRDDLLVFDSTTNRVHSLSAVAATVWQACDGETKADDLSTQLDVDPTLVARALEELRECELLETGPGGNGITRRALTSRAVRVGAAVTAAPLIASIVAPVAEGAMTPTIEVCNRYNNKSCNGCCRIAGCCCGCHSPGNCKGCFPTNMCPNTGGTLNCPGSETKCDCSCEGGDIPAGTLCTDIPDSEQGGGCFECCGCSYPSNCDCTP